MGNRSSQAPRSTPAATTRTVHIVVNGLAGPRCTIEASTEWTILQVRQAISEKISVPVEWQTLVKDSEKLPPQAALGSLLPDEATNSLHLMLVIQEVRPVNFVGMRNGLKQLEPGHLWKTGGAWGWHATAVSSEGLVVGQDRGLRFRPGFNEKDFMIGLGSRSSAPVDYREIDYVAYCCGNGQFYVYESSAQRFFGAEYSESSIVELNVTKAKVEFLLDGVLQDCLQLRGEPERLFVMASFLHAEAEVLEIQWL